MLIASLFPLLDYWWFYAGFVGAVLVLLALANFGVLIWGSVLIFSNGQYGASRAGDYSQCAQSLYDPASRSLERHHLEPLETTVRTALGALDLMNEVLERVRRDCGDDA